MRWITEKRNEDGASGVYLLLDKDLRVLYVGQSETVKRRARSHRQIPWKFYRYTIVEDAVERANLEHELLVKYKPIYNKLTHRIIVPSQVHSEFHRAYTGVNREERWKKEAELISQYGALSCRKLTTLLFTEYGICVNHNTVHADLRLKKHTPYL